MKIVVCADESGTHDKTGAQAGSREGIVAGIGALTEGWSAFCRQWQSAMIKYNVPYFHFTEWSSASAVVRKARKPSSTFHKNPYKHLDEEQLNKLIHELAKIAGGGSKVIVGGCVYTQKVQEAKASGEMPADENPYNYCLDQFFDSVVDLIGYQKPPWKRVPIAFFFDQTDDREWRTAITDKFFFYKKKYPVFSEIAFADKKVLPHLPLQAADMIAYRFRQITTRWVDENAPSSMPELDNLLFKTTFDFLDKHKREVMAAYVTGKLDYEYWNRKGAKGF